MKKTSLTTILVRPFFLLVLCGFLLNGLVVKNVTLSAGQEKPEVIEMEQIPSPFPHLDKFYPPQTQAPVLLIEMLKLAMFYHSVGYDAVQNDWENARRGFENFKKQIIKLSGMIPKWKQYFKMDVVEELGRAVAQKNVSAIMEVRNKKIGGGICGKCHGEYRTQVWFRYHWKDFGKIMVADPVSQKNFSYFVFMTMVAESFEGIKIDTLQNQPANARKAFQAFTARVGALKKVCRECHDPKQGEMRYFVSSDVMGIIDELGAELSKTTPTHEKVEGLFMGIGIAMCYKCHQVHGPAATVQKFWRKQLSGQSR